MPAVPAVCDTCGAVFPSGILLGDNVSGVTMAGNTAGPCPRCGGMGRIRDGVYPSGRPPSGPCPCGSGKKFKRCHGAA